MDFFHFVFFFKFSDRPTQYFSSFSTRNIVTSNGALTAMKKYFKKRDPITIIYRDYRAFDGVVFRDELKEELIRTQVITIDDFIAIFKKVLDRHAPSKKKIVRGNQAPFMNKTLSKAFMTRARLRNKYYRNNTPENKLAYTKHKNLRINLLERERKKILQ